MDMNTTYGGLAAALVDDRLWVMNVVSSYAANTRFPLCLIVD